MVLSDVVEGVVVEGVVVEGVVVEGVVVEVFAVVGVTSAIVVIKTST